jgi:hypothetical protein
MNLETVWETNQWPGSVCLTFYILSGALLDEILKARNSGKFVVSTTKVDGVS